jgi:membrane protease YdiL (CAAX protease family)
MPVPALGGVAAVWPLPRELVWAAWLAALAPGALSFAVARPFGGFDGRSRRRVHVLTLTAVAAVLTAVCGLPRAAGPSAVWSAGAVAAGFGYFFAERGRLALMHKGALRAARRSSWSARSGGSLVDGFVLAWAGAMEELVFRWYALWLPVWFGLLPPAAAVAVGAVLYGGLHHEEGPSVMASRAAFGAALGAVVVATGQLWAVVVAHVAFNIAVYGAPVQYLRPRGREFAR